MQSKMNSGKSTQPNGNINTENHGAILVARMDRGPHALLEGSSPVAAVVAM